MVKFKTKKSRKVGYYFEGGRKINVYEHDLPEGYFWNPKTKEVESTEFD